MEGGGSGRVEGRLGKATGALPDAVVVLVAAAEEEEVELRKVRVRLETRREDGESRWGDRAASTSSTAEP